MIFPSSIHNLLFFPNRLDKLDKELYTPLPTSCNQGEDRRTHHHKEVSYRTQDENLYNRRDRDKEQYSQGEVDTFTENRSVIEYGHGQDRSFRERDGDRTFRGRSREEDRSSRGSSSQGDARSLYNSQGEDRSFSRGNSQGQEPVFKDIETIKDSAITKLRKRIEVSKEF